jgi:hypothetical protein
MRLKQSSLTRGLPRKTGRSGPTSPPRPRSRLRGATPPLDGVLVVATAFACATSLAFATPCAASRLPALLTYQNGHHALRVRPTVVGYTGDGTGVLGGFDGIGTSGFGHMSWLTWTTRIATGSGAVWLDDCEPNCAEGTFSPFAVTVRAFAPRNGYFTRLTLRYNYNGKAVVDERGVRHYSGREGRPGSYEYFIVHVSGWA